MSIGMEFQPGAESNYRKTLNSGAAGAGPNSSEVLRVLSLRLPTLLGGRPIAAPGLLTASPAPGPSSALLDSLGVSGPAPVTPGSGGAPGASSGDTRSPIQQLADALPSIAQIGASPRTPLIRPGGNPGAPGLSGASTPPGANTGTYQGWLKNERSLDPLVTMLQHFFPQPTTTPSDSLSTGIHTPDEQGSDTYGG